ncbi:hypothetical protein JW935_17035 [candidate division KSB1 bacterium]|nr:hypothetical protein [candidate division KSB1 bacterium]
MKRCLFIFAIGFWTFFNCEKDSQPTAPSNDKGSKVLATDTIGPEGGAFGVEDFELKIPAGAFRSDNELELELLTTESTFGENNFSRRFRLGLPAEYYQPLELRIQYQGTLTEESYIAIAEDVYTCSLDTITTAYRLVPAKESSGYLVCQLPAPDVEGGLAKTTVADRVQGDKFYITIDGAINGYMTYVSHSDHFKIVFPNSLNAQAKILGNYLEEAYNTFKNMGFEHESLRDWPASVTVKELDVETFGNYYSSGWGDDYGYLEINSKFMDNLDQLRITAGHEFFHLVQALYDPRWAYTQSKSGGVHVWLDEATAVWAEEYFTPVSNYFSSIREGHYMAPFYGMQKGAQGNAQEHGYGMSAMIKYLVQEYGVNSLVSIYKQLQNGKHPVEAVDYYAPQPISYWWGEFLQDYVLGNLYEDVNASFWVKNKWGEFILRSDRDTLFTFSGSYPDLSGKLYYIKLDYAGIDKEAEMVFELTEGALSGEIYIMEHCSNNDIIALDYGSEKVMIPKIRELKEKGSNLFVLVSNSRYVSPYTGTSDIELQVRIVKPANPLSKFDGCSIHLGVWGHYLTSDATETKKRAFFPWSCEGSFEDNVFHGSWDEVDQWGDRQTGDISAEVDLDKEIITVFSFTNTGDYGTYTKQESLSGSNIPLSYQEEEMMSFLLEGTDVCSHIQLTYRWERGDDWEVIQSIECDENSGLEIIFGEL